MIIECRPGWSAMEHVEKRVQAKYGADVLSKLREREIRRHTSSNLMVEKIPRGEDVFQRNLRALEYIASGRQTADKGAIKQLYADALADLDSIYPMGVKSDDLDFHEVWKHVLDATRDDAERVMSL